MPTIEIPDIPDDVLAALEARAAQQGVSVAEMLRAELMHMASHFRFAQYLAGDGPPPPAQT